ncbi:MAG: type I DNA topoisomerase [Acidobacteria bacterium]|nr:type I DNA topoisomerase [Acidobacteriota bacterium]
MSKALVIVESPAKAKTINKFLGKDFVVKASLGHLRDLPKTKLGVDEDNGFTPTYVVVADKKKKAIVAELQKAASKASAVFLAPDADREGEAISFHLKELLSQGSDAPFHRVRFNEITKKAILAAFASPSEIDEDRVNAQQTRRILDRLVGYKLSPLLWEKIRRGISAGRVQSVALRMITEREREVLAFKAEEYWSLTATLEGDNPPPFLAKVARIDGKKASIPDQKASDKLVKAVKGGSFAVTKVTAKKKTRKPVPPFITSQLQQAAASRHGFAVKRTMMLAQHLYEGMEIKGHGSVGLITYMRTDSTRISDDALEAVRAHIGETYGDKYLPAKPNVYKARKGAQESHEAIRPTSLDLPPDAIKDQLKADEWKVYNLIWKRFVASQMTPAIFDTTSVDIEAGPAIFRANGSVLKFPGFLEVYGGNLNPDTIEGDDDADQVKEGVLPPLAEGDQLKMNKLDPKQHFTQPPPRYSEATLVKALEENGIGRPSTYASIIQTLATREYVEKEQKTFRPTELGTMVCEQLVEHFGDLINVDYTASMEEELDRIEEGTRDWVKALTEFNKKFNKDLKLAKKNMKDFKRMEEATDETCSKCSKPMIIRWGRFGKFMACSGYPECKNTQEIDGEDGDGKAAEETPVVEDPCEKCGKEMIIKRGRFGKFIACTGYPDCKNTRKIMVNAEGKVTSTPDKLLDETCPKCGKQLAQKNGRFGEYVGCSDYPDCKYIKLKEIGVPCPKEGCKGGQVVERRSRRGRTFYGCSNYPDCDFVAWNKPLPQPCPQCKSPYIMEKITKRWGTQHICPSEECEFKETVVAPEAKK